LNDSGIPEIFFRAIFRWVWANRHSRSLLFHHVFEKIDRLSDYSRQQQDQNPNNSTVIRNRLVFQEMKNANDDGSKACDRSQNQYDSDISPLLLRQSTEKPRRAWRTSKVHVGKYLNLDQDNADHMKQEQKAENDVFGSVHGIEFKK
jgi:hypothetical protein